MKFNCNKIKRPRAKRWFAWYPVQMSQNECVWLEFIWRIRDYRFSIYDYDRYSTWTHDRYSYTEYGEYTV
jgi:hypothetical protein